MIPHVTYAERREAYHTLMAQAIIQIHLLTGKLVLSAEQLLLQVSTIIQTLAILPVTHAVTQGQQLIRIQTAVIPRATFAEQ